MSSEKQKIREKLRRKQAMAFQNDIKGGQILADQLADMADLLMFKNHSIVAGYVPIGNELDPRPLLAKFLEVGAQLCLPEVIDKQSELQFRAWQPGDMLTTGLLGTLQPLEQAEILLPDLILAPLLGIDELGVRIGQGGGFYDRSLVSLYERGGCAFGVAFDSQLVDILPREAHDQLLDGLITPSCCKWWNEDRQVTYLEQL